MLIIITAAITSPVSSAAFSGRGVVNVDGAIIDSACAISSGSREQTIDMDTVPIGDIIRDGHGTTKSFSVTLIHCELSRPHSNLPDWRHFQVTFDGDADGKLFGISGEAKGVALEIADSHGNKAAPGKPLPFGELRPGSMKLDYTMKLVSNSQVLKSGEYTSAVRFKMDYY
ncbi:fimbrial protein [Serratia marcescens]|uniref:fimbrial protein n=1 Tax=Serratia marcescens TaxID=615 RepID=UPI0009F3EEF2|nr:pilin [Serratia nematodiphila]